MYPTASWYIHSDGTGYIDLTQEALEGLLWKNYKLTNNFIVIFIENLIDFLDTPILKDHFKDFLTRNKKIHDTEFVKLVIDSNPSNPTSS